MSGFLVECKNCHTQAVIPEGGDPHHPETGLQCTAPEVTGCCTQNHHHGESAAALAADSMPSCRPIIFHANAVTEFRPAAGLIGQGA